MMKKYMTMTVIVMIISTRARTNTIYDKEIHDNDSDSYDNKHESKNQYNL